MKVDREKRTSHLMDPELRQAMVRLLELWESACRFRGTEVTDFYDPHYLETGSSILRGMPEMCFAADGGYDEAERARFAVFPSPDDEVDFRLAFIRVEGNFKFRQVSHRDYLGSLMGLGLLREKIGDILVQDNGCQVILDREIADYVVFNWTKVNQVPVKITPISRGNLVLPQKEVKEIRATVASLRLDAVMGLGFGCSRPKTLPDIKGGRVRVNWKTVIDPSFHVKEGDQISCQGKGRMELAEVSGLSQKGRIFVRISRYM